MEQTPPSIPRFTAVAHSVSLMEIAHLARVFQGAPRIINPFVVLYLHFSYKDVCHEY
jgi:hypothetical protein